MKKNHKDQSTLELFLSEEGQDSRFQLHKPLSRAIGNAIADSELGIAQIAAKMTDLSGRDYTAGQLRNWSAPSHKHIPSADTLPVFCAAAGSTEPMTVLCNALRPEIKKNLAEEVKESVIQELGMSDMNGRQVAQ
ncbi:MAG: hypothetical protein GY765_11325 [bacterium]|nr:hypothetical protein [bacterium]